MYLEKIDWKSVESFFYRTMLTGWIAGGLQQTNRFGVPPPGYGHAEDRDGRYAISDMWSQTPDSSRSHGNTTILYRSDLGWFPIWYMSYEGEYAGQSSKLVKEALCAAYTLGAKGETGFLGCRGPLVYRPRDNRTRYVNIVDDNASFVSFSGIERVRVWDGNKDIVLGWHQYRGRALID
ncbi:MAG: hypothetical protein RLZZ342_590 [Candidatus Parcubacteria bacterium]|jgi:hypothetical protein